MMFTTSFLPASWKDTTYSGFVQYDLSVVPDRLRVIAGSKFEHNDYTGFEYQPQIRAVWTPSPSNTLWAAYSRAVRIPAEIEEGLRDREFEVNEAPPTFVTIEGHPGVKSEILHASELGYRYEWEPKILGRCRDLLQQLQSAAWLERAGNGCRQSIAIVRRPARQRLQRGRVAKRMVWSFHWSTRRSGAGCFRRR